MKIGSRAKCIIKAHHIPIVLPKNQDPAEITEGLAEESPCQHLAGIAMRPDKKRMCWQDSLILVPSAAVLSLKIRLSH